MNYSHDNWSAILAHIGKPEELDTSARNAGALTRRREIRDAATLLRLGLAYGPGGMSLREVTAWAQLHDVATLSDVALLSGCGMPPTGLAYLPHKHLLYAPQLRVVQAERDCVLSMEQQSVRPGAAALNGDYIWDMILIPVSSLILS